MVIKEITQKEPMEDKTGSARAGLSPQHYQMLVEMASDGVWLLDKNFMTVYVNPIMEKMLGYTKEEMIGKSWYDFGDPEWVERAKELEKRRESGIKESHEFLFIHKDGNKVLTRIATTPLYDKNGNFDGAIGVLSDITLQKASAEALKVKDMLNSVSRSVDIGLTIINPDYTIAWYNDLQAQMFGILSETKGRNCFEVFQGRNAICPGCPVIMTFETGVVAVAERKGKNISTGTEQIIALTASPIRDASGNVIQVVEISQDITERKTAEILLKERSKRYEALFEQAGDGIFMLDTNGKILSVNETFARMHGFSAEEIMQIGLDKLDVEGMNIPERMQRIIAGETLSFEVEHYHKDGHIFPLFVTANLISTANERFIIAIHRDLTERKRGEMTMRLHSEIMKNMTEGVYLIRISDGQIVYANPKFENMFGYNPGELIGKQVSILNAPNDKTPEETKNDIVDILKKSGEWHGEVENIKKDGTHFYCFANVSLFDHPEYGSVIVSVHTDITERKKVEEEMIESELRLREIIDNAPFGAHMYELHPDGRLIFTGSNPAADHILGKENKQFINKTIEEAFPQLTRTEIPEAYRIVAKKGGHFETESIEYRENNIIGAFEVSAFQTGQGRIAAFFRDISERKKAEYLIKKSKEFTETIINSMNDAITIIDVNNFRIIDANLVFLNNYGVKKEEVLGRTCYEFTHKCRKPCNLQGDICPLVETLKTSKTSTVEHVHYINDGEMRYIEVSTTPIIDENGTFVNVIHLARDITERKIAEEKIKSSLKEKEILLKEIHHRVKNNMQVISSLLGLASGTITDKKYVDMFMDSQNRINSMALIHENLYRSKDLAKIDLNDYIRDLANNLFHSHRVTGRIELLLDIKNVSLGIDLAIPCGLIINELITNSLKYAFPGDKNGQIKVSACRNDENMIELIISDNGVGIPSDIDFKNTRSLGLHLVTMLAEGQLHGRIDLDRTRGTEFSIIFKVKK